MKETKPKERKILEMENLEHTFKFKLECGHYVMVHHSVIPKDKEGINIFDWKTLECNHCK